MNYDQTSFALSLQKSAADIALMESRVAKHRQNADLYRSLIPAEEAPAPTEEIIDHGALDIKATLTAEAAESNNAVFLVSPDTVLQKEYLAKLREKKYSVTLRLYQADTLYGTFFIHGKDIPLTVEAYEKTEGSNPPVYKKKDVDPLTADWQLKDVIDLSSGTAVVKFDPLLSFYGSFAACKPEKYERYEKKYHNHDIID